MTIHCLEIVEPAAVPIEHWTKVASLRELKRLDFVSGLNVLFAPNGYGKSTILNLLAVLSHCRQAGLPAFTHTSLEPFARGQGTGAKLTRDVAPVLYADPSERPGLSYGVAFDYDFLEDGVLSAMTKASSGEWCNRALSRVIASANTVTATENRTRLGDQFAAHEPYKTWLTTQVTIPVKARLSLRNTILLDEFDRSFDIPMAAHAWAVLSRFAVRKQQFIVAGHSPMVIALADAGLCNLVDLCPGYVAACREALRLFGVGTAAPAGPDVPMPFEWRTKLETTAAKAAAATPKRAKRT